jgi:NDP-sugar pyrophosphorylase family protein
MRALILAGGKGTRLAAAVPDRPKILAPINGTPFLEFLIGSLARQGLEELVFLLGDRHEPILEALRGTSARWSIEREPLGTGGALKLAQEFCREDFFLVNGDTYLDFDARGLVEMHRRTDAAITLAAAKVEDAGRYGKLEVEDGRVVGFREKDPAAGAGLINGGVYVVSPRVLDLVPAGRFVSLENEVFPQLLARDRVSAVEQSGAFFDIGTESSWKDFARWSEART